MRRYGYTKGTATPTTGGLQLEAIASAGKNDFRDAASAKDGGQGLLGSLFAVDEKDSFDLAGGLTLRRPIQETRLIGVRAASLELGDSSPHVVGLSQDRHGALAVGEDDNDSGGEVGRRGGPVKEKEQSVAVTEGVHGVEQ